MAWGRPSNRTVRAAAAPLALLLAAAMPAAAPVPEAAVKAAFVARFGAYVDWPATAAGLPAVVCLVGRNVLGQLVDEAVTGQMLGGLPIAVRHLGRVDGASGCRIAYLAGSSAQSVEAALAALAGAPVLTVTDAEVGPAQGMIHFEIAQHRVRFRIDQAQAVAARLSISSKLMALALSVRARETP